MNNMNTRFLILGLAESWLKDNPERLTDQEKEKFRAGLKVWLNRTNGGVLDDEVYDFLVSKGIVRGTNRHDEFASYINKKYSAIRFKRVLDVGAGRMCHLSGKLSKFGYRVTALDPKIRINENEARGMGINISKRKFYCDYAYKRGKGFNVQDYDLIVGLEPCDATEHIIRQAIMYNIPFEVLLCCAPHDGLNGEKFDTYLDWYKHLESISDKVKIIKHNGSYIATSKNDIRFREREM